MEIGLAREGYGKSGGSGFAVATEAERAQHGVEFRQVMRMSFDGEN